MAMRQFANRLSALTGPITAARASLASHKYGTAIAAGGALTVGCVAGQTFFGSAEHFYDHRFTTSANPNDLAEFYGNEDFMEIFCVFPFMVDFMMRSGTFDDAGTVHTFGLPGSMEVSMQFEEHEEDTTGDGENDTTTCFNKQERFHDTLFGFQIWDMVQNFGYKRNADGTTEVYHYGQRFRGPFPIRMIFQAHAMYVIWATEQHVNSPLFGADAEEESMKEQEIAQRHNIPFHVFHEFLGGLQGELEEKLVTLRAADSAAANSKSDAELIALRQQIAELEDSLAKINAAQLRRADTSVVSRVTNVRQATRARTRRSTLPTLAPRDTRTQAADAEEAEAELQRVATRAKLALKVADEDVHETIKTAVAQVEEAATPKRAAAALQRRMTALYSNPDVHAAAFKPEDAAPSGDADIVAATELKQKREEASLAVATSVDDFTAELAKKKDAAKAAAATMTAELAQQAKAEVAAVAAAAEQAVVPVLQSRATGPEVSAAPTPVDFAQKMIRRATMIRRQTLTTAAEMANQGHRVEMVTNKFNQEGCKIEETKMVFHPKPAAAPMSQ